MIQIFSVRTNGLSKQQRKKITQTTVKINQILTYPNQPIDQLQV
jgi:hypothetical protein